MADLRQAIEEALLDKYGHKVIHERNKNWDWRLPESSANQYYIEIPIPREEQLEGSCWNVFVAADGHNSIAAASIEEITNTIMEALNENQISDI